MVEALQRTYESEGALEEAATSSYKEAAASRLCASRLSW